MTELGKKIFETAKEGGVVLVITESVGAES